MLTKQGIVALLYLNVYMYCEDVDVRNIGGHSNRNVWVCKGPLICVSPYLCVCLLVCPFTFVSIYLCVRLLVCRVRLLVCPFASLSVYLCVRLFVSVCLCVG